MYGKNISLQNQAITSYPFLFLTPHSTNFSHTAANQTSDLRSALNIYVRYVNRVCVSRARCVSSKAHRTRPHTSQAVYFSHFLSILQLSVGLTTRPCSCGQSITPAPPSPYQHTPADPRQSLPGRLLPAYQYSARVLPNLSPEEIKHLCGDRHGDQTGCEYFYCHLII